MKYQALIELADACNAGACNTGALICSLAKAIEPLGFGETRHNPAVKCILGQLSHLCGESIGPSTEAVTEYEAWRAGQMKEAA